MTKQEFKQGWALLVLQPWGWRYNRIENGVPTPDSLAQLDFYYAKLNFAEPEAWMHIAELYAQGNEWPSVNDLKRALQQVAPNFVKALPAPDPQYTEMPQEVRDVIDRVAKGKAMPE